MSLFKHLFFILDLILLLACICSSQAVRRNMPTLPDWDYLLYSQRWPVTGCAMWEEAKPENTCNLPQDKSLWTVHGIWPTKTGTDGPQNCPSAIHFDPEQLAPIMSDLQNHWTNVEANTKPNSFWKHEWDKHGTCASILPQLDSIINYFQQGLDWNIQYKLSDVLGMSDIIPSTDGHRIEDIHRAVKAYTEKEPIIQCVTDRQTKNSLISEIRICFNKTLQIIDCDQTNPIHINNLGILTNCNLKKPVMYYAEVPTTKRISYQMDYVDDEFKEQLGAQLYYMDIYRLLKFLMWLTI